MATVEKDFKVKNGLLVANGGSFGGAVEVGTPTDAAHAATKEYVDSIAGNVTAGAIAPSSPVNGTQWFDTSLNRLKIYNDGTWYVTASYEDAQNIPQHIHDTSIGGSGLIVSYFTEGGGSNDTPINALDGGGPETTEWQLVLDGGSATSNFV